MPRVALMSSKTALISGVISGSAIGRGRLLLTRCHSGPLLRRTGQPGSSPAKRNRVPTFSADARLRSSGLRVPEPLICLVLRFAASHADVLEHAIIQSAQCDAGASA